MISSLSSYGRVVTDFFVAILVSASVILSFEAISYTTRGFNSSLFSFGLSRLFVGFSTCVNLHDNKAVIEWSPQAYVRESVLDYVQLRRERGASAAAIAKILLSNFGYSCISFWQHAPFCLTLSRFDENNRK